MGDIHTICLYYGYSILRKYINKQDSELIVLL